MYVRFLQHVKMESFLNLKCNVHTNFQLSSQMSKKVLKDKLSEDRTIKFYRQRPHQQEEVWLVALRNGTGRHRKAASHHSAVPKLAIFKV